jgi:AcrR family transcriptional regulator
MSHPTEDSYHHDNLVPAARQIALTLLNEAGPAAITMREIAKRLGVTHRSLYRWYSDPDALLLALATEVLRRLTDVLRAGNQGATDQRQAFVAYLRFAYADRALNGLAMACNTR